MDRISVSGQAFVDEHGRERIFNGVNMVFKGDHSSPDKTVFLPEGWDEEAVAALKRKGVNAVRLGLIWEAIEPKPGEYDDEYLGFYSDFADLLAKYEIYFFLDMHQDLYGNYGLPYGGDGAPKWAYLSGGKAPKKQKFVWAEGYFFPGACHTAFDNFWGGARVDGKSLQDYFCNMWMHVAEMFKDKENLLGFDVFNEPFPGSPGGKAFRALISGVVSTVLTHENIDKKQLISTFLDEDTRGDVIDVLNDREVYIQVIKKAAPIIKEFDLTCYYPFLRKVAESIRRVTENGVIFMESCYYSNLGIPCSTPRICYKDGKFEKNLVFAPHGYDLMVDTPAYSNASNERVDHIFDEHARTQKRLDAPVLVGEWGGFYDDENSKYTHLIHLINKFDANRWSNTYWVYWNGFENSHIMDILSRPYPQAVPGNIISYGYDYDSKVFTLEYETEKPSKNKCEIYLPAEPSSVEADGKYDITDTEKGKLLKLSSVKGFNKVKLTF